MEQAALIIIGNEILSGRTHDINTQYIASNLTDHGIVLKQMRTIEDDEAIIVATVNELRDSYDYVFTTGGIGPTHDDITALSIAKAFGVEWERNEEAYEILKSHYGDKDMTEASKRMAKIPSGAELIKNPVSGAPGFVIGNVYVMAGVPNIMQAMFDNVLNTLKRGTPILACTVSCELAESEVADTLEDLQNQYPDVEIGSYPFFKAGRYGVNISLRSTNKDLLREVEKITTERIESMG